MLENGFIKIYRSLLNWEWYQDTNTKVIFLHLLLTVNYEDGKWKGREIKRGQRITSYQKLAEETNISVQSVRTAIKHLILTGEVTNETTNENSLITVKNYEKFQQLTNYPTAGQQAGNTPLTSDQQTTNNKGIIQESNNKKKPIKDTAASPSDVSDSPHAPKIQSKHQYGEFGNVHLTDDEYKKLKERFGDWQKKVASLDSYIASKGAKYKSHYATILSWANKNGESTVVQEKPKMSEEEEALIARLRA